MLKLNGQDVISSDDQKLGHVVGERDNCAIVEHGHVFKTRRAIPLSFLAEADTTMRATITKEMFESSPNAADRRWDKDAILMHYGLMPSAMVDPDPAMPVGAMAGGTGTTSGPTADTH
jgi:hypothetical protein